MRSPLSQDLSVDEIGKHGSRFAISWSAWTRLDFEGSRGYSDASMGIGRRPGRRRPGRSDHRPADREGDRSHEITPAGAASREAPPVALGVGAGQPRQPPRPRRARCRSAWARHSPSLRSMAWGGGLGSAAPAADTSQRPASPPRRRCRGCDPPMAVVPRARPPVRTSAALRREC
jgi:hypothetical protein